MNLEISNEIVLIFSVVHLISRCILWGVVLEMMDGQEIWASVIFS